VREAQQPLALVERGVIVREGHQLDIGR